MSTNPQTTGPTRPYPHEPDRYGYGGGEGDCPKCGALTPDYCPKRKCEWEDEADD